MGGASYLKVLQGPLPQVELMPTGGAAVKDGRAHVLTERAREFVAAVTAARKK